MYLDN